jgi:hypothetical protein
LVSSIKIIFITKRFKQYLTGVITDGKPTVSRIASRLVDLVDQSSVNRSLTLYS